MAVLILASGCASQSAQQAASIPVGPTFFSAERPIPYPPFESPGFERAVERGTRTRTGSPGPNYWQQFAEYSLRAELNPRTTVLTGSGTVRYHNRSPDALGRIVLHLYQNIHAPDAERNRRVPVTEGARLTRVVANGTTLASLDSADTTGIGYRVYGTIVALQLPQPVPSGATATLDLAWSFRVPPAPNARMGQDGEVFHLAFWYPQVAVYDDISGWDAEQYRGRAEFYMGYADYEVAITVPAGWVVSGTGELVNQAQVLPERVRQRLSRARASDEIVHVVGADERAAGSSTARGRQLTWRFQARNVRDFAWNASNRYVWDATRALIANRQGGPAPDTVMIHALYRPGVRSWERAAEFGRHSVEFLSRLLWPYPYPQMTAVEGIITGGMEFPMITVIGAGPQGRTERSLYSTTNHEIGHMWFPMAVGSNERRFTWMDEGLTVFNQLEAMRDFFPGLPRDSLRADRYLPLAAARADVEPMRHGDLYDTERARAIAGYDKPAMILHALRAVIGEEPFWRAYREYGRRWSGKHPQPWDLFNTFEAVSGRRLGWFWRTWFYETWRLDQAIAAVDPSGSNLLVTIEDRGLAPMPVRLAITRADGGVELIQIPVEVWLSGRRRHVATVANAGTVRAIEIDPESFFPDVDRSNQRWQR